MTVEIRTQPPIVQLHVRGDHPAALTSDPFGQMDAGAAKNAKIAAKQPMLDTSKAPTQKDLQAYYDKLDEYNRKTLGAISVFIEGMNELDLQMGINAFQERVTKGHDISRFEKGTRFGGRDKGNINSIIANLLKHALPYGVTVSSHVKLNWEVQDVVRYASAIRDELERRGIAQPNHGHITKKSGFLSGFGVYKVAGA